MRTELPEEVFFLEHYGCSRAQIEAVLQEKAHREEGNLSREENFSQTLVPHPGSLSAVESLVVKGVLSSETYFRAFAAELGLRFLERSEIILDGRTSRALLNIPLERIVLLGICVPRGRGWGSVIAPRPDQAQALWRWMGRNVSLRKRLYITAPESLRSVVALHRAQERLPLTLPALSAATLNLGRERALILLLGFCGLSAALVQFPSFAILLSASLSLLLFFPAGVLRWSAALLEAPPPVPLLPLREGAVLPRYTVLLPVYREARVIAPLLAAITRLIYPETCLEILLLIEEDDCETWRAAEKAVACLKEKRGCVRFLSVPISSLRTKPKALNYGLAFATGAFVVVYDAEDRPEPDQLLRVLEVFQREGPDLGVVQASLAIYNTTESFFTRHVALEYAALFDVLLPALSGKVAFPLGGTSNHMRREALDACGGWDPANVTEDADLGVRLSRFGWRAATVDSTTWEEATVTGRAWFFQRARWHKGWIQTECVHWRHPLLCLKEQGLRSWAACRILLTGGLLALGALPLFLGVSLCYYLGIFQFPAFDSLSEKLIMNLSLGCCLVGYGGSFAALRAGAKRRGLRFGFLEALQLPFYFCLMFLPLLYALYESFRRPFYWSKTEHFSTADPLSEGMFSSSKEEQEREEKG